jgi:hypothetical protein
MKLFYLISTASLLFLLLPKSSSRSLEKRIRSLEANVSNLKHEVDDLLIYFKTCNKSVNVTFFRAFVGNYLHNETTARSTYSNNGTEEQGILQKLKQKIKKLLNFSKRSGYDDTLRLSRSNYGKEGTAVGCTDLKQHLKKFVNCLDVEDGSGGNETVVDVVEKGKKINPIIANLIRCQFFRNSSKHRNHHTKVTKRTRRCS